MLSRRTGILVAGRDAAGNASMAAPGNHLPLLTRLSVARSISSNCDAKAADSAAAVGVAGVAGMEPAPPEREGGGGGCSHGDED